MMSPQMIQDILLHCTLSENQLSQRVIVPCLQKMNMGGYLFRDIKFVGGTSEDGNDIEFYEIIGPDKRRLYTGIQVKKGNIGKAKVRDLVLQGTEALLKSLSDTASHQIYHLDRWIVTATGEITQDARDLIYKQLGQHGKLISFWDGIQLAEFIMRYWYDDFIRELKVPANMALSENVRINLWDPANPRILTENFCSSDWTNIDVTSMIPTEVGGALYLSFYPLDGNFPSISVGVKTSQDDLVVDSTVSQVNLVPVRLAPGEIAFKVKMLNQARPIKIASRGFQFII